MQKHNLSQINCNRWGRKSFSHDLYSVVRHWDTDSFIRIFGSSIKIVCGQSQYRESHTNHSRAANHFSQATFPLWTGTQSSEGVYDPSEISRPHLLEESPTISLHMQIEFPFSDPPSEHPLIKGSFWQNWAARQRRFSRSVPHVGKEAKLCLRACWSTENEHAPLCLRTNYFNENDGLLQLKSDEGLWNEWWRQIL